MRRPYGIGIVKRKVWIVLFLVIVVCISTGMLSAVYVHTDPIVRENERTKVQANVLELFGIPYEETTIEEIFELSIDVQIMGNDTLYRSREGSIAFEISGSGFWGKISALIALGPDLDTIRGLKVLKNMETPGLGGRIAEDWFQDQFEGKKLIPELKIIPYRKAEGPNEVDAITGATQTSRAFERIINNSTEDFRRRMEK
jgi:Na+-transporting NADH:ubiquinone oxidoreductase subunit C